MREKKTIENYLKTIYALSMNQEPHAYMIADELGVTRPTVSVYLRNLERDGYLTIERGKVIYLTPKGESIAKPVYERFQILQRFLAALGVSEKNAYHDACQMEHCLGIESYEALKKLAVNLEQNAQA